MGLIKKPAGATLPPSTVGEPIKEADEAKTPITPRSTVIKDTSGLDLRSKLILAQNACGNVQSSQEWANISMQLVDVSKRKETFEKIVREYFDLALVLAQE